MQCSGSCVFRDQLNISKEIAVRFKEFWGLIVGKFDSLGQSVYASTDFNIHISVVDQIAKFVEIHNVIWNHVD